MRNSKKKRAQDPRQLTASKTAGQNFLQSPAAATHTTRTVSHTGVRTTVPDPSPPCISSFDIESLLRNLISDTA